MTPAASTPSRPEVPGLQPGPAGPAPAASPSAPGLDGDGGPDGISPDGDGPAYPDLWQSDVVLRDGSTVHLRPIRPSDADRITAFHARLSAETIYFRFFSPLTRLSPKMLNRFVQVDYVDRFALIALLGDDIVAVGRYDRLVAGGRLGDEAEVAFLVDDAHQGRGLATVLLEHLVARAAQVGITRFLADTLPDNNRMLRIFHEAGFDDQRTFADGVVRVVFPIQPTEASVAASHQREREAAARSMRRILAPHSVAVIGASRRHANLGHELVRRLLQGGFNGPVYPVNPDAPHIHSVRAYPTIMDVPDRVDLAVIAVPAAAVPGVVEQCGRMHVGSLVVISSGFAERDAQGLAVERQLVTEARRHGMRLIGPNCMGIVNTDPAVSLNATFSPMPPRGRIGLIAQSGALGVVILDELARRGLGVSTFVSAGNKADVSGNDLLQYWDDDPATDVVAMYIETFGNPRTFARVARRVSRSKPIVAVRSGRSEAALRAGRWTARRPQSDASVDALFRQAGVIRTETLEELFDVAQVLASQPLPAGRRVAIVGNNGGPGVLAADACVAAGLELADLSAATRQRLSASRTWEGPVHNPVDLAPDARPDAFGLAVDAVLDDEGVDAVIALYTSPEAAPIADVAAALAGARGLEGTKPVLACVLGRRGLLDIATVDGTSRSIPSFAFPEAAARALGRVAGYAAWRARPTGSTPAFGDIDREAARAVVAGWTGPAAPDRGAGQLGPADTAALLRAYGLATTEPAAGAGLTGPSGAGGPAGNGGPGGDDIALTLSVSQDPLFGPLVRLAVAGPALPASGPYAERLVPVTDVDATELRQEVLGPLEGRPVTSDEGDAIDEVVTRVGRLVEDLPEVAELAIDLRATGSTAAIGAVTVRLAISEPRPDLALRRLR